MSRRTSTGDSSFLTWVVERVGRAADRRSSRPAVAAGRLPVRPGIGSNGLHDGPDRPARDTRDLSALDETGPVIEAATAYRAAVDELLPRAGDDAEARFRAADACVLSVLVTRDRVARVLDNHHPEGAEQLLGIAEDDRRLTSEAAAIDRDVGAATLKGWRETRRPPAGAWWWALDERAAEERAAAESRAHPAWGWLATACLLASFYLMVDISFQLMSVGADSISLFLSLTQVMLALVAGSAFTELGRRGVRSFLCLFHLEPRVHHRWKFGLAVALLVALVLLKLSLPVIAHHWYYVRGVREQAAGRLTGAIERYGRAIALDPGHPEARYQLGLAYEDVREYDKAIDAYQAALLLNPRLERVANNLARLYMLRRADYGIALELLTAAIERRPADRRVRYTLHKNLAWAYLGLSATDPTLLDLADLQLRVALPLEERPAAAYCLRAQVLEKRGDPDAAFADWQSCLIDAVVVDRDGQEWTDVEAEWRAVAEARVMRGGVR